MNRLNAVVVIALVVIAMFSGAYMAQAQNTTTTTTTMYTVQPGDNLWNLAGLKLADPLKWSVIREKNQFLQQPGRMFTKEGIVYVIIRPGEHLQGLEELGIIPTLVPLSQLGIATPAPVVVREVPKWTWWILGFALLVLAIAYLIYRMLTSDPVNSRPPMVEGGINTPEAATIGFQQMAARRAGLGQQSTDPAHYQRFNVLSQTPGRVWGILSVLSADGKSIPRRLNGDRAYQARVRFADGHEEELFMLQGCGNDLKYGGISRYLPGPGFRFEADTIVPAPAPVPPAPPAPAPPATSTSEPATADPAAEPEPEAEPVENGVIKIEIRGNSGGQQAMARLSGVDETRDITIEYRPGVATVRFFPLDLKKDEDEKVGGTD